MSPRLLRAALYDPSLSETRTRAVRACFADVLAHQPLGSPLVTTALDQRIKHEAILIDGTPEPVLVAADRDDDLIQMPFVAKLGRATADRSG